MGIVLVARLAGSNHGRRRREDDVDVHAHQFGRELRQLLYRLRPAKLDDDVLALDVAEVAQARPQRLHPARASRSGPEIQVSDPSDFCRLLRARRVRPRRRRATEQSDELAPPHSITSSARNRNDSEIVRPSTFAVLRLTASSNFSADCTGNSLGLAPFKILSM
jgi:hypothetical protein